jgi:hypothetical protein
MDRKDNLCYDKIGRFQDWDFPLSTLQFALFIPIMMQLVRDWAHARLGFFHFPISIFLYFLIMQDWDVSEVHSELHGLCSNG